MDAWLEVYLYVWRKERRAERGEQGEEKTGTHVLIGLHSETGANISTEAREKGEGAEKEEEEKQKCESGELKSRHTCTWLAQTHREKVRLSADGPGASSKREPGRRSL